MFAGLILKAAGSAYYHLAPDNARLVWDRIPIMIVYMALVSAVIADGVSDALGLWLFPAFEAAGVGSMLLWQASELNGHGDLRFYRGVAGLFNSCPSVGASDSAQVHARL